MTHEAVSRRGGLVVLAAVAALLTLLLPAAALAITATPTVTIVGPGYLTETPPPTAAAPTVGTTWVLLYLDDGGLGADAVRFSNDGGATWGYAAEWSAYQQWYLDEGRDLGLWLDGPRTVTAQFSDDAGETWGPSASATTILDLQGPVVAAPEGYWNSRYAYKVSAHDQIGLSGVQSLWYRVDAGQLTEVTNESPAGTSDPLEASFGLTGASGAAHSIDVIAMDYAGNYSGSRLLYAKVLGKSTVSDKSNLSVLTAPSYVVIDSTAPTVRARGWDRRWHHQPVRVRFSASDHGLSGVDFIQYSVTRVSAHRPGAWTTGASVLVARHGRSRVWFRAADSAQPRGNVSRAKSVVVKID